MTCPFGLEPFRTDTDGQAMPLFAPSELIDAMRKQWPRMWIEPFPDAYRLAGSALTFAEWQRLLQESSQDSSEESSQES